jgi:glycosyltransferase involved in cell wall biosynthesis
VDGGSKRDAFLHADVCVVPSFTENFGMVAAEALAHGVPVIASRGTPWADLEKHGCGLWVDNTPAILARSIMEIRSENLYEMGKRGRVWMQQDLTWGSVAAEMFDLYQDLSER